MLDLFLMGRSTAWDLVGFAACLEAIDSAVRARVFGEYEYFARPIVTAANQDHAVADFHDAFALPVRTSWECQFCLNFPSCSI